MVKRSRRSNESTAAKKRRVSIEKVIFWIGSLTAIANGLFTVFDRLTQPSPAELLVDLGWTKTVEMTLALDVVEGEQQWTKSLPACLRVRNVGDTVARGVQLRIVHLNRVRFLSKELQLVTAPLLGLEDGDVITTMRLQDINPGAEVSLEDMLQVQFSNTIEMQAYQLDRKTPIEGAFLTLVVEQEWEARVSASEVPETQTTLYVRTGREEILRESGREFVKLHPADEWQNWRPELVAGK